MEIIFTDNNGNILTEKQKQFTDSYIKVYKENNRLRKEEYYDENNLTNTFFYIEFGESHQNLLELNLDKISINEIEDINLNFIKYHHYGYYQGILKSKGLEVRANNNFILMSQELNILTNLPNYNKTYKFYEDKNNGYEFEFKYYPSGELASVRVSNDAISFYEQYRSSELDLIHNFEWWNQYSSYYLNAEPAVPKDIEIIINKNQQRNKKNLKLFTNKNEQYLNLKKSFISIKYRFIENEKTERTTGVPM